MRKLSRFPMFHNFAKRMAVAYKAVTDFRDPADWLVTYLGGGSMTSAGQLVTEESAIRQSAAYACVNAIAQSIGMLPLETFRQDGNNTLPANDFYIYQLLHDRPNDWMTSIVMREATQAKVCLYGNGYCDIEFDGAGRVAALWPIPPKCCSPKISPAGQLYYEITPPNGSGPILRDREEIFHIPGFGFNGVRGQSPIDFARETFGSSQAAQEFGNRFFQNDARPSVVLMHPDVMDETPYKRLQESFEAKYGAGGRFRPLILEDGVQIKEMSMTLENAQFLELRKFGVVEIARMFRVPLHMINELDRSTNNNIEQQGAEFVTYTLQPHLVRWEQEIQYKLLGLSSGYFAKHNVDELLRGDMKSRFEAYGTALDKGFFNRNEVRKKENMNPLPAAQRGDETTLAVNVQFASKLGQAPTNPAPGAPATEPDGDEALSQELFEVVEKFRITLGNLDRSLKRSKELAR